MASLCCGICISCGLSRSSVLGAVLMTFIAEFADMMAEELSVQPGYNNEYGEFVASGTVLAVPCRVETANRLYRASSGREVVSTTQVYCGGVYGLTVDGHRYTLPTDTEPSGRGRVAIAVFPEHDEEGPAFDVVYL